jgi:hypothetical protein
MKNHFFSKNTVLLKMSTDKSENKPKRKSPLSDFAKRRTVRAHKGTLQADEVYSNKLYLTMQFLDPAAFVRLSRFMRSPYFNQSKILVALCDIMLNHIEQKKEGFGRQKVWKKLFPNEPYDDVYFRKACSDLLELIQRFMSQESFEQNRHRQQASLVDYITSRKVSTLYNSVVNNLREKVLQKPYCTVEDYYQAYILERRYYQIVDYDTKLNIRANLENISRNLDVCYLTEKLRMECAALTQRKVSGQRYDLAFTPQLVAELSNFPVNQYPELATYYYSYLTLLEEDNVEHYHNLRRMLEQYGANMPHKEAVELYDAAMNYCVGKTNKGNRDFLKEYFELSKEATEKLIFIENNQIAPLRFINIVIIAVRAGQMQWAEQFIHDMKGYLPPESRENITAFNLARVYLYQKQFGRSIELLRDVEYEDIGINVISKTIQVISYYELDEFDALDSFTEAFKTFLTRQKNLGEHQKLTYLNLIKHVKRLMRIQPNDKVAIEKLREEVLRDKSVTVNHDWLMEKINEL